ncbi:hypothetical protein SNEBB_002454 [Seison nebaliae]|nr:hypothetical protein SNEBB_002454 [Seison nebaliae]
MLQCLLRKRSIKHILILMGSSLCITLIFGFYATSISSNHSVIRTNTKTHQKDELIKSEDVQKRNEKKEKTNIIHVSQVCESISFKDINGGVWKQGWPIFVEKENKKRLNVFIVPHSHNDPGWIKTYENYFETQTKHILDSLLHSLYEEPNKRFIWAEISYLYLWWNQASNEDRKRMKYIIEEKKRMQIVTGGWVMPDEANSDIYSLINQLIDGHQWLNENMPNVVVNNGWSIDPFGYGPTNAYLLSKSQIKSGSIIQRVHYILKKYFASKQQLRFFWKQLFDDNGKLTKNLIETMPFYSYDVPHTCGPDPAVCCQFDFARIRGLRGHCPWGKAPIQINPRNIAERATTLVDQYRKKASLYSIDGMDEDIVLIPLGDDFRYQSIEECKYQFQNYDKLIDYINEKEHFNVAIQYGTLEEYFKQFAALIGSDIDSNLSILDGDFFTYADREDHYWSGYFTTRPFYKRQDRRLGASLRMSDQLSEWASDEMSANEKITNYDLLISAHRTLSLFQHHDGITGTSVHNVVLDYGSKLKLALRNANKIKKESIENILRNKQKETVSIVLDETETETPYDPPQRNRMELNERNNCKFVGITNSIHLKRKELITIRISTKHPKDIFVKHSESDEEIPSQIELDLYVHCCSNHLRIDKELYRITFPVNVKPFSMNSYAICLGSNPKNMKISKIEFHDFSVDGIDDISADFISPTDRSKPLELGNFLYRLSFDRQTTLLKSIEKSDDIEKMEISFKKYQSSTRSDHQSGAYLFLPQNENGQIIELDNPKFLKYSNGQLEERIETFVGNTIKHTVQLISVGLMQQSVTIKNEIMLSNENVDVAMRIKSNVENYERYFFTDSNRHTIMRRRFMKKLPLQGNVYPMPSSIFLEDNERRLTVTSTQPLGTTSPDVGVIEIFLDRRSIYDDNRGMGQGVTDNVRTESIFNLVLEKRNLFQEKNHLNSANTLLSTLIQLSSSNPFFLFEMKKSMTEMKSDLFPCSINVEGKRRLFNNDYLIVFHHILTDEKAFKEPIPDDICIPSNNHKTIFVPMKRYMKSKHFKSYFLSDLTGQRIIEKEIVDDSFSMFPGEISSVIYR